jgi:hypothetical protein
MKLLDQSAEVKSIHPQKQYFGVLNSYDEDRDKEQNHYYRHKKNTSYTSRTFHTKTSGIRISSLTHTPPPPPPSAPFLLNLFLLSPLFF